MKTIIALIALALCASSYADIIPGLAPVDIYLNLEKEGFTTEKNYAVVTGKNWTEFICRKDDGTCRLTAIIYIPKDHISQVTAVAGVVQNLQGEEANLNALSAPFLSYLATLPYSGSEPVAAKIWVAGSMGKNGEKLFGPAKIEINHEPAIRALYISTDALKTTSDSEAAPEGTAPRIAHLDRDARVKSNKIPALGATYFDVQWDHGNPVIKDPDTGWATWPKFKVLFKDGKAAEVTVR